MQTSKCNTKSHQNHDNSIIMWSTEYCIAENFGGRKLWQIDHQQKLANNILVNVLDYIAHIIQNDIAVEKEHALNSKASLVY